MWTRSVEALTGSLSHRSKENLPRPPRRLPSNNLNPHGQTSTETEIEERELQTSPDDQQQKLTQSTECATTLTYRRLKLNHLFCTISAIRGPDAIRLGWDNHKSLHAK